MSALEIILIVACAAIVIGVIVLSVIRKKQGKSSCGCGCSSCPYCDSCKTNKK